MKLGECIDRYILADRKDVLIRIYKNIIGYADNTFFYGFLKSKLLYQLNGYDNLDSVLKNHKVSGECKIENFTDEVSCLIFGIESDNKDKLIKVLREIGFMYETVMPEEIVEFLVNKYKENLRMHKQEEKQLNEWSLLLKMIFILSTIYEHQIKEIKLSLDELQVSASRFKINSWTLERIICFLVNKLKILNVKSLRLVIPQNIEEWIESYGKLEVITQLYEYFLENNDSNINVLNQMALYEEGGEYWIKEKYLVMRYGENEINNLCKLDVIRKFVINGNVFYKRTDIGVLLSEKLYPRDWISDSVSVETEERIFIPHNFNPFAIMKFLLKYNLNYDESDFLLVFNKHKQ
jgi:hypothetical protein